MKREEFLYRYNEDLENMRYIIEKKSADYWKDEDIYSNFKWIEKMTNWKITTEMWMIIRIMDKISRIVNIIIEKKHFYKKETVEDTLLDLANYALLLKIYIEKQKEIEAEYYVEESPNHLI